jgi:hypothetical protein
MKLGLRNKNVDISGQRKVLSVGTEIGRAFADWCRAHEVYQRDAADKALTELMEKYPAPKEKP